MDTTNIEIGFDGEKILRDYLKDQVKCKEFGQLDLIAKIEDKWYLFEVKHQDRFTAPPFDGHGLPPWQINFRLKIQQELGIIPVLFVVDKETGVIYYESIDKLNRGQKFITKTGARVVFPLDSFKTLQP
jgi:hypothetical protein